MRAKDLGELSADLPILITVRDKNDAPQIVRHSSFSTSTWSIDEDDAIEDCTICPIGWYVPGDSNDKCFNCPTPSGNAGDSTCLNSCNVGKYKDADNNDECTNCDPGKYSVTTDASVCIDCPVGQYNINIWTLSISSQAITKIRDVVVTQGSSTGTLKKDLTGDTTTVVIHALHGVTFVDDADLVMVQQ